jgi:glycosyltransferase involved in cell wall biosynthesis
MADRPIHVVHVMPQIGTGGAEKQLYALIVNSDPAVVTHEVLYFSDSRDDEAYRLYAGGGVRITRVPRSKKRPVRFVQQFAATIRACQPDIVHCWLFSGSIWGRWAALHAGARNVIIAHRNCDLSYAPVLRFLEMFTTGKVHYLANSRACGKYIGQRLGVSPDRFNIIYNGLRHEAFDIPSQRKELFGGLEIPNDARIVTMVGRLMPQKNYPMFVRVACEAKSRNMPLHFVAVGTGTLKGQLESLAASLDVSNRVHFIGIRNDIPAILRSSDIFLFTTLYEGFPNAILEAMAAGLPVITTDFEGADELVSDGVNGRVVPIDDVHRTVAALQDCLDDPEGTRRMATTAQSFVRQEFSMQKMVARTTALYKAILAGECQAGGPARPQALERYV